MPSELTVPITEIKELRAHPDADRLELATVLGWQLVVGKGLYSEGQRIIYVPPDSVMPEKLSDELDITKFLSNGRVRQAKLRGEPSFGATVPLDIAERYGVDPNLPLGTNVATELGITKYEPPVRPQAGDAVAENALFQRYTSISNIRNFPDVITDQEEVILTEKIHGTNCRVGIIEGDFVAGSHGLQRKEPENIEDFKTNLYWFPLSLKEVRNMLIHINEGGAKQVILYGETFGKVQKKYNYGIPNGIGFRAFDLFVDGRYLDYKDFYNYCERFNVPTVPLIGAGFYSYQAVVDKVESYASSTLDESHPIEGAVIKPMVERHDPKIGRVVLKYISNAYLFGKGGSDYKDE